MAECEGSIQVFFQLFKGVFFHGSKDKIVPERG